MSAAFLHKLGMTWMVALLLRTGLIDEALATVFMRWRNSQRWPQRF